MTPRYLHRLLIVVLSTVLASVTVVTHADPSNKWRVKLNSTAQNDGTIVLRIAPVGGTPIDVTTKIPARTRENHAADILRDSLRASLGEGYHVETDDGEDVLIKKRGKTPNFELTLMSSSLTGLQIELERE